MWYLLAAIIIGILIFKKEEADRKKRELETKQIGERNRLLRLQVSDCKERIANLEDRKSTVEELSRKTAAFEKMFAAIGISDENKISDNQAAQILNLQKQINSDRKKLKNLEEN